ncbi:MAG: glutamine synthetase [Clostridia bacterium]|nr:glutamine synthetase [Clostridia bacterium]
MKYSEDEIMEYVREEDVKFIRLAFCDVFGKQKNISILADELPRAFKYGIAFDASAIKGFGDETHSDLFLHPEPDTLKPLPWRPEHGRVVRMLSSVSFPDGKPFECDTRSVLKKAVEDAKNAGFSFSFGAEQEFYLFNLDEKGRRTTVPYDEAGYMDIAPDDKGENVRREICLTLEQMGLHPESSHHEEGPGQNEIDFRYADPMTAADDVLTFQTVVRTVANRNGLFADFSPKPLENAPGNGFHVNVSVKSDSGEDKTETLIAGLLSKIAEISIFLNPEEQSYARFGKHKAPQYISWSYGNRSQLIRVPAAEDEYRRIELRSPDPTANPYLVFSLVIYSFLDALEKEAALPSPLDVNLFSADKRMLQSLKKLPGNFQEASLLARNSDFVRKHIPAEIREIYCR